MLDDLLGKLGDSKFDPRKVIDLIDDLWDNRGKIVEAVDFVWDNRDSLQSAIGFVRDHADDVVELAGQLPALLGTAGEALEIAGRGAGQASNMLLGDGDGDEGVSGLADQAAEALERCQAELWSVMAMFDRAGSGLAALPLIGSVADPMVDGASRIGTVSDDLGSVARRLRSVGGSINDAGLDLGAVGQSLGSSGSTLRTLVGSTQGIADVSTPIGSATKEADKERAAREKAVEKAEKAVAKSKKAAEREAAAYK